MKDHLQVSGDSVFQLSKLNSWVRKVEYKKKFSLAFSYVAVMFNNQTFYVFMIQKNKNILPDKSFKFFKFNINFSQTRLIGQTNVS